MIHAVQKSFTVMLREPEEAFPQNCTAEGVGVNNMPVPGFRSSYF